MLENSGWQHPEGSIVAKKDDQPGKSTRFPAAECGGLTQQGHAAAACPLMARPEKTTLREHREWQRLHEKWQFDTGNVQKWPENVCFVHKKDDFFYVRWRTNAL